ncbi:MAG: hypothetical protein JSR46_04075 [Verrucomicrobia bacterium]|nr:hypothetical protein [Verrucomicrobiota bacterium]
MGFDLNRLCAPENARLGAMVTLFTAGPAAYILSNGIIARMTVNKVWNCFCGMTPNLSNCQTALDYALSGTGLEVSNATQFCGYGGMIHTLTTQANWGLVFPGLMTTMALAFGVGTSVCIYRYCNAKKQYEESESSKPFLHSLDSTKL